MNNMIYSEADYAAIVKQQRKRWLILGIPCAILTAVLIVSLFIRLEWLTTTCTIVIGALLIAVVLYPTIQEAIKNRKKSA